jgi:ribosomal protein S18 acetylase RimI-like enzyme
VTSSSAPPGRVRSRLGLAAAVRLHARRFDKSTIRSAVTLLTADRRITHPAGGVVALTRLGHTTRWTVVAVAVCVPTIVAFVMALLASQAVLIIAGAVALNAAILLTFGRVERQLRGRRIHTTHDRPWMLSDIATEPQRRIGDLLLDDVGALADATRTRVVLEVHPANHPAIALYQRHGFHITGSHKGNHVMQRSLPTL